MFKWGILSTAKIARTQLIPAIEQSETGVVHAIASRDLGRAQTFAKSRNIPCAYGSYEELLEADDIDGVYIPLPTAQHIAWSIKAANAGKHVLCEKPIALNADDITPVIEARDANQVIVSEAFMVFYHPQWHKVRELISGGAIGALKHIEGSFAYFNRDPSNMRNILELGGGALPDIGVYPTVVTRMATGKEPISVSAKVTRDPDFGTDIYATMAIEFPGFEMSFYVATQLAQRQHMVFHGTDGFIEVKSPFNAGLYAFDEVQLHNQNHSEAQTFRFSGVNQYTMQVDAFAKKARGEEQKLFELEDSVRNQKLIDAIYRSEKSGEREAV